MLQNIQHDLEVKTPIERHTIKAPVLFVDRSQEGNNGPEMTEVVRSQGLLPDLRTKVLERGHRSPIECTKEVAELIADFVP